MTTGGSTGRPKVILDPLPAMDEPLPPGSASRPAP